MTNPTNSRNQNNTNHSNSNRNKGIKSVADITRSISPIPTTSHSSSSVAWSTKGSAAGVGVLVSPEPSSSSSSSSSSHCTTTGKTTATMTTTTKKKKKQIFKERWVCDVCRIAAFDDYEEACRHEESCGKQPCHEREEQETVMMNDDVKESCLDHVASKDQESTDDSVVVVTTEEAMKSLRKEDENIKNKTNKTKKKKTTTMIKSKGRQETTSLQDHPNDSVDFENTPMVPKKLKFSLVPEKRKDKQHICHFDPCEICHVLENGSCAAKEQKDVTNKGRKSSVKMTTGKHDATLSKTTKSTSLNAATTTKSSKTKSTSLNATTKNATVAKTAPIFLKHTQKEKQKTCTGALVDSTTCSAVEKSQTVTIVNKDKSNNANKTPRTIAFASIFQKPVIQGKNASNVVVVDDVDGDDDESDHRGSPSMLSEQEQKAILAEHRAAEFVSKRRKQLQEERERQRKKEERKRLNPMFLKREQKETQKDDNGNDNGADCDGTYKRRKGNSGKSVQSPIDLVEIPETVNAAECNVVVKRNEKKLTPMVDVSKYPPRFPNPSHIGNNSHDDVLHKETLCLLDEEHYDMFVSSPRHVQSMDSVSLPNVPPYKYHFEVKGHAANKDSLFMHFSSVFQPCQGRRNKDDDAQGTNQLWSEKHAMQAIPHSVYGDTNKEVAEDLIRFIDEWKNHRQQVCDARAEKAAKLRGVKKRAKKRNKKHDYDYDDDDFLSDDDDGGLPSVYLMTGETGSGKTSLAHAAARHCQCELIEINTSMDRSGKALKKEIEECSQSLSNLALLKKDKSVTGGILQEEDDEILQGPSLSIILIDEVDLIFESDGDTGFWQSLSNVAKKAKCPIILTASNAPMHLKNSSIQYEHSILVRPSPYECASKMTQIARAENMTWRKDLKGEDIKKAMAIIAKFCECDLRKIMNEMQVYALGSVPSSHLDIPQKSQVESFGNECRCKIKYPRVNSVMPCVVPANSHSVVTVKGSDFLKDGLATVTVGDQLAPSRIIDEHTILVAVPPCQIPSNVDRFGIVRNSLFEESLNTRYVPVHVSVKGKNGLSSKSNFTAGRVTPSDTSVPLPTVLQYSFDGQMDADMNDENDNCSTTSLSNVSSIGLLEKAANNLLKQSGSEQVHTALNSSVVSCSPLSSTQEENNVDKMTELSKKMEYFSDMTLFRDSNDYLKLPLIAGCMEGSDHVSTDDVSSVCGWEDPSLCRGFSDCYVTLPTSRRDRVLTSKACFLSNNSTFHCDIINATFEHDDVQDDGLFTFRSMEEESYLSRTVDENFFATSHSIIEERRYQSTISMFATSGIMSRERDDKIDVYSSLLEPIMSDVRLASIPVPEFCWLDDIPHLRKIAVVEAEADKNYAALKLNCSDVKSQGKRRSTRRSTPKGRQHYFDTLLGVRYGSDNSVGKDIGDELSQLHLQYDRNTYVK